MADSAARSSGADITLVHGGVGAVADAVMLARATRRILRQNLGWAFGCNLLLVTLAAAGILPPVLAAVAMATNSVTVVGNALRLRRFGKASGHRGRPPRHGLATPAAQPPTGCRFRAHNSALPPAGRPGVAFCGIDRGNVAFCGIEREEGRPCAISVVGP